MASNDMDTPPPELLPPSSPSGLPRSGLGEALSATPAALVQAYAISKIAPLFTTSSNCADDRWKWGLLACVAVTLPAIARSAVSLARTLINNKR